jgi:glycosyltransferase involved in cell wall biosynthesis
VQNKSIQDSFDKNVRENSIIIPNPVEKSNNFDYQSDSRQLIAVGRLVKEKNFLLLIDAFSDVLKVSPKLNLVIYGEGPLRSKLESKINDLGLAKNILLPGVVDDIFIELSKSCLFVQTSLFEGQSNALLEAMAQGLPVVTTLYDGVDEVIENNINGWISEPNPKALSQLILYVMYKREFRIHVAKQAKSIGDDLSLERIYKLWESLIY